jgi:hypothetical protein
MPRQYKRSRKYSTQTPRKAIFIPCPSCPYAAGASCQDNESVTCHLKKRGLATRPGCGPSRIPGNTTYAPKPAQTQRCLYSFSGSTLEISLILFRERVCPAASSMVGFLFLYFSRERACPQAPAFSFPGSAHVHRHRLFPSPGTRVSTGAGFFLPREHVSTRAGNDLNHEAHEDLERKPRERLRFFRSCVPRENAYGLDSAS